MSNERPLRQVTVGDLRLTDEDKRLVNQVLDSNRLSYGPVSRAYENLFARIHDSRFAIFTNSGTSSLHIAVAALKELHGWKDGDEVIVPAVTFVATANVVLHNNLRPVFVDVDPATFNIDPTQIESAISDRTRCIVPVHLLGLPADMSPILEIAKRHDLRVIEDSCETMFARYRGQTVGSFGDIGCFSTYVAHYIVTGVGGLTTTSEPKTAILLRSLAHHGRDAIYISVDDDDIRDRTKFHEVVKRRFNFVRVGHSFRATEMEAALGLSQLKRKDEIVARRKQVAATLISGLLDLHEYLQLPTVPNDRDHVFMLFGLVSRTEPKRELVNFLEDRGIETRDLLPLTNQPIYRDRFGPIEDRFPVAKHLNAHGFYIGCHQYLSGEDIQYVVDVFHEYYSR
jgi:perosamine synthetase